MDDVVVDKAAHDMHNGVHLADIGEELISQALALAGAAHQPAMSTNSMVAGVYFSGWYISASLSSRWSGTATTPIFGSMVQNG